jgi:hypothetical protein
MASGDRVFRPSTALIATLGAAVLCWLGVLGLLLRLHGVPGKTYLSVFFFIGFFGVFIVHYSTQAIVVYREGLVVRRFRELQAFSFEDIMKVDVTPGLAMTLYDVMTRQGPIQFSSWFRGHRELLSLIVSGAKLSSGARA